MDNILVVPDVHGRTFWENVVQSNFPVVFLGDYLDPYSWEGISKLDAIENFSKILEFANDEKDRVTLLLGNHDCHMLGLSDDICRIDWINRMQIYHMFEDNKDLFKFAYRWNNTLFTHAGCTTEWLKQACIDENPNTIESDLNVDIEFTNKFIEDPHLDGLGSLDDHRGDIGCTRGGYMPYGSCTWADVSEMIGYPAFKDTLIQIFGHSQLKETGTFLHRENWYMCDSRAIFEWNGETLSKYEN